MKKHKYIDSHFVEKYENGMYAIIFNTYERWIDYHQYSEHSYLFGSDEEEYNGRCYDIEEFLPKETSYLPTSIQNKDQITFYFIPYSFLDRNKRTNIKNKQI